ncbi:MAG: hypothetical protein AB1650_04105 [Candidatus Omnitrophota bacterium]
METKRGYKAQTFLEYVLMITVVTAIMIAMSTMLKRGVQGMVKVVSDQVGFQVNAEQQGGTSGYLVEMTTRFERDQGTRVRDRAGNITYDYVKDETKIDTVVLANAGYTEE